MSVEQWPKYIKQLIIYGTHLNRSQRIRTVCFLIGNGVSDPNLIYCLLQNKLSDRAAAMHVKSTIKDALSNKYDNIWTYHSLMENCILFLNGKIAINEQSKISVSALKIAMWNRYSWKHKCSLKNQMLFFGEDDVIYPKVYRYIECQ